MKRKPILKIVVIILLFASGAARAEQYFDRARVISVNPEYEQVSMPQQECYDESAPARTYPRSGERSYGGSIVGGITGALIGNQIGRGHGREAATAAGAITGAIIGDQVQNQRNDDSWAPRTIRRCRDVERWGSRLTGYRVVYEYGGHRYTTLMPNDPGNTLRVRVSVDAYED
ncbi:MAG: glycine zipper 2TM domain-containing protein [Sulfuricella denitrificans]|nr:glycine zipper 2TM domain-containing protein [Sulfuricella denitrificans]